MELLLILIYVSICYAVFKVFKMSFPKIPSGLGVASSGGIIAGSRPMFALLHSLAMFIIHFFKSPRRLEAENLSFAINSASPGGVRRLAFD